MFSIKVSKKLVRGLKLQLFQFQNQDVVLVKKQKPSPQKKIEANQQFLGGRVCEVKLDDENFQQKKKQTDTPNLQWKFRVHHKDLVTWENQP